MLSRMRLSVIGARDMLRLLALQLFMLNESMLLKQLLQQILFCKVFALLYHLCSLGSWTSLIIGYQTVGTRMFMH